MRKLVVVAVLACSVSLAQINLPKGTKEINKKVENKIEKKSTNSSTNKNTDDKPVKSKEEDAKNQSPASQEEGGIPKTSKAYIPWTNYDRNLKLAKQAQASGDKNKFGQQVKYCIRFLDEMKTKDPSLDYSSFEQEVASMKVEVDNNVSNAAAAESADESMRESILNEKEKYDKLYESQSIIEHSSRNNETPVLTSGKEYLEVASAFKKDEVGKSVEQWMASHPNDNAIKDFKSELSDYENYITYSGILKYSNKLAERSYELSKQKNTPKAIDAAENAKGYCEGILTLSPNNQAAKAALIFAEKAYSNASASVGQSFTSNFHKQNVNKIVFSKKPLVVGSENLNDVSNTFNSGDEVYGTVYFSDKMANILREGGTKFYTSFTINGEAVHFYDPHITIAPESKQNSYLQFALVPSENYDYSREVIGQNNMILDFNKYMAGKAPVSFKIELNGEIGKTNEKLHGEFNYDISAGVTKNEKIQQKMEDLFAEAVRLPKPAQNNPDILSKMSQLLNTNAKHDEKYSNGRITSGDWKINKNELGIIIDRTLTGYFVETNSDGHCEMVGHIFSEDYSGNGTYSGLRVMIDPFESKRMNCANAGK